MLTRDISVMDPIHEYLDSRGPQKFSLPIFPTPEQRKADRDRIRKSNIESDKTATPGCCTLL
jgi:hypothetical protein